MPFPQDSHVSVPDWTLGDVKEAVYYLLTHASAGTVTIRKTGVDQGTRAAINLLEGSGISITVADDPGSGEVDITITATGGPGSVGPQGPPGMPGQDGEEGESWMIPGPSGPSGAAGTPGTPGAAGAAGATVVGPPGTDGEEGESWMIPGPMGPAGAQGTSGTPGAPGAAGPAGQPGPWGLDGEEGESWMIPGPVGPKGDTGAAGGGGGSGTTTLNLGSYPGVGSVSASVSATAVQATSVAEAWIQPKATADHSVDEHSLERLLVTAEAVAGVGLNLYLTDMNLAPARAYGVWNVGWRWS